MSGAAAVLAFTQYDYRDDEPTDVYVVRADSTGLRNVTRSREIEGEPVWSPDGRTLAFTAAEPKLRASVWTIDFESGERRRLTPRQRYSEMGSWSPQGDRVAYSTVTNADYGIDDVFAVAFDGTARVRLTHNRLLDDERPRWSPESRWIAFLRGSIDPMNLYLVSPDGRRQRRLTSLKGDSVDEFVWIGERLIVFVRLGATQGLYAVGIDGRAPRRLLRGAVEHVAASPDGTRVVCGRRGRLWIVDVNTRVARLLARGPRNANPAWSPDGRTIAFRRDHALWTIRADGGGLRRITRPRDGVMDTAPTWRPR